MQYIISVDIGTSTIRACLYGHKCQLLECCQEKVEVEISGQDQSELRVEIDPDKLFAQFLRLVRNVLFEVPSDAKVSLSFCCQRGSFVFWDKKSMKPLHKIVCWNDMRSRKSCENWNKSFTVKALNAGGGVLHFITRQPRFLGARIFKFITGLVSNRAMVTLDQLPELRPLLERGELSFGCLETWLMFRLSGGRTHVAETSNASATGLYDPYIKDYNRTILRLLGFPLTILPPIVDSSSKVPLCVIEKELLGREVAITAVLADQQSALYGCGCWEEGDVKISLGTGTFLDLNTGDSPHSSFNGLYPLVGWCEDGRPTYVAEGKHHDTAVLLKWAQQLGLFSDVSETNGMAQSVPSSHGVVFVPAFGGLQTPIDDSSACCAFMGLRPDTTKEHMVRAILESIAFRVYQIFDTMRNEVQLRRKPRIRVCGGVAANDFICQSISDLVDMPIERVKDGGLAACTGVALMAGVQLGLWHRTELPSLVSVEKTFTPHADNKPNLQNTYQIWLKAVDRCTKFY